MLVLRQPRISVLRLGCMGTGMGLHPGLCSSSSYPAQSQAEPPCWVVAMLGTHWTAPGIFCCAKG